MNKIRIIGGKYKNRRISILERDGLRPSPERVRETLFNWLQFEIQGMRVLDLFAGSGAMGLEALSRGADFVDFCDNDRTVSQHIQKHLREWQAPNARVHTQSAFSFKPTAPYDLVILDPPFALNAYADLLALLDSRFIKPHGYFYWEYPRGVQFDLPVGWVWHKHAHAGHVNFGLAQNLAARQSALEQA